jgi:hypothetical protein
MLTALVTATGDFNVSSLTTPHVYLLDMTPLLQDPIAKRFAPPSFKSQLNVPKAQIRKSLIHSESIVYIACCHPD